MARSARTARASLRRGLRAILAAEPQIAFAFVFGSFTEDRPFRDIDVGAYVDGELGRPGDLEERLTRAAAFPVDLVLVNGRPVTFLVQTTISSRFAIVPGQSLLFLDEIQACPSAFPVLGDFRELQPEQHVIAAGSLLDFALREFPSSMPVGRIEYLYQLRLWDL